MEKFDGFPVDSYGARFSGTFDLDDADGSELRYGETRVGVVIFKVGPATFKEDSQGDMKRVNVFAAEDVYLLDKDQASDVLVSVGVPVQMTFSTPVVATPSQPTGGTSLSTDVDEGDFQDIAAEVDTFIAEVEDDENRDWDDDARESAYSVPSSPSTVGASQHERDPMLARFLER